MLMSSTYNEINMAVFNGREWLLKCVKLIKPRDTVLQIITFNYNISTLRLILTRCFISD